MIRAKLRCLEISYHIGAPMGTITARFRPVTARNDWNAESDEETSEENALFWEATPSGEMEIRFPYGPDNQAVPFKIGGYYFVDMAQVLGDPEASEAESFGGQPWRLYQEQTSEAHQDVKLALSWSDDRGASAPRSAELHMGIANVGAFEHFAGRRGSHWSVTVTPASPADAGSTAASFQVRGSE